MRKIAIKRGGALASALFLLAATAGGRSEAAAAGIQLRWTGTQKLEQIIGDVDWATGAPTKSRTFTNYKVLANGLGYSFEHFDKTKNNSELIFLFGDTTAYGTYSASPGGDCNAAAVGAAVSVVTACTTPPTEPADFQCPKSPADPTLVNCLGSAFNYLGQDPIARSGTTDPEAGLHLHFLMNGGLPLFVTPTPLGATGIATGGDDIPNSGISLGDKIYIVYSTGSQPGCAKPCDPFASDVAVLVRFDERTRQFETLRELSSTPDGGHFVYTAMHVLPAGYLAGMREQVLIFGIGDYRNSNVYLALVPQDHFETGIGTRYFTGLDTGGRPLWTAPATTGQQSLENQSQAQPLVIDNAPTPSIGNISVAYEPTLGLWLLTYDANGTSPPATRGVFFRFAAAPWGPWSEPQSIFNACADGGFGAFIHYVRTPGGDCPAADPSPSGPAGPTIAEAAGQNDPETSRGGSFAPLMIERFTTIRGQALSIYYTMSTWNPYTVVKMRSDFAILRTP